MIAICPKCNKGREVKRRPEPGVVCRRCKNQNPPRGRTEYERVCQTCGDVKKTFSKKESKNTRCKACYLKQIASPKERICIDCGDRKEVKSLRDSEVKRCRSCNRRWLAKKNRRVKPEHLLIRHLYFCVDCADIAVKASRIRRVRCSKCAKKQPKKQPAQAYFDMETMTMIAPTRYFRICPYCPEEEASKQVQQASLAGIRPCAKHKYIGREEELAKREAKRIASLKKTVKARPKRPTINRKRTHSPEAIAREREKNKLHREAVKKEAKLITQTKTEEEMLAEFLAKHEPSVKFEDEAPMEHLTPRMNLSSSSVLD